ncbi:MAG: type II secretion system F family protein [Lentisphaeria bacterium]|nr:type II secretion system F family protein [Lentisphaeria bacterium]
MSIVLLLASISIGISAFCCALFFIRFMNSLEVEEDESDKENTASKLSLSMRMTLPMVKFFRPFASNEAFESRCNYLNIRLGMAGLSDAISGKDFLALQFAHIFIGFIFYLLFWYLGHPLMGIILGLLQAVSPMLWLNSTIKKRHLQIMKALPNLLDLLTLSVEAGKDFISSLRDILAKRKNDALNEEFTRTFHEIQLGKKRSEALRELSLRVNHSDLSSVLNAIIQAEELGVSIGELLRIQGDMLRNKRFTLAEKLANEAPVKIILPIVIFIFPAVLIILIGPIAMQAVNMF